MHLLIYVEEATADSKVIWTAKARDGSWVLPTRGSLKELTDTVSQISTCDVLIPAETVLLVPLDLPPMRSSRLAQAIPFSAENQLIEPIENYHWILLNQKPSLTVAFVAHAHMRLWLESLKAAGLQPNVITNALWGVATPAKDTWSVAQHQGKAWVRISASMGFCCHIDALPFFCARALETSEAPTQITMRIYDETLKSDHALTQVFPKETSITI